jgi:TonB family protein
MRQMHRLRTLFFTKSCAIALLGLCLIAPVQAASPPDRTPSPTPTKRWVEFELSQAETTPNTQTGQPVMLTILLGGVTDDMRPIVVTCDSIAFQRQTVTLELEKASMLLKGTVPLEPIQLSRTSVPPKAARIQVTFSQSRQNKLERLMRQIVYVTMDPMDPTVESLESPPAQQEKPQIEDLIIDEAQPGIAPISLGSVDEETLVKAPPPEKEMAYWQQVSHLISQAWAQYIRGIRREPSGESVKVRFKMFPTGRAQLIRIEKGSGAREVDEAGIYAVVNAQPFLPIPRELGNEVMDVHVRMQTGKREQPRPMQPDGKLSINKPVNSVQPSKK